MKAVLVKRFGTENWVDNVAVETVPKPTPGDGEVLVQMSFRPVDPADILSIKGQYPGFKPKSLPAIPGVDGVGTVAASGPNATRFSEGQRVVAAPWPTMDGHGTWAEFCVMKETFLVAVPAELSDEDACHFFVNPITAYGQLDTLSIPKGDYLLQGAASSTLGRMLIKLAKHQGIKTINVIRSAKQKNELKSLGADEVVVSTEEDIVKRVKEVTNGRGAYGTLDPLAGKSTGKLLAATRAKGQHLIYGVLEGTEFTGEVMDILFEQRVLRGFWLSPYLMEKTAEQRQKIYTEVLSLMVKGILKPHSGKVFPLDSVKEALKDATSPGRAGKPLLKS